MRLNSNFIKKLAVDVGFQDCGIAKAEFMNNEFTRFTDSIKSHKHAEMAFLERNIEKRFNPSSLLPNCKSVIVVTYNYLTASQQKSSLYRTAKYTWITDYHILVNNLLQVVADRLIEVMPMMNYKITVDSSTISEKNWAVRAGIGCFGKNGLIHNDKGSFFVIGTLLIDQICDNYDTPHQFSDCGNCNLCVNNCPTNAITEPFKVDATKCISYLNTEYKTPDFNNLAKEKFIFGCDICQDVCPKNKKIVPNLTNELKTSLFLPLENADYESLTEDDFRRLFKDTSIFRRKYQRFRKIIDAKRDF